MWCVPSMFFYSQFWRSFSCDYFDYCGGIEFQFVVICALCDRVIILHSTWLWFDTSNWYVGKCILHNILWMKFLECNHTKKFFWDACFQSFVPKAVNLEWEGQSERGLKFTVTITNFSLLCKVKYLELSC